MVSPWIVDAISRMAGIDVYGVGGFYIPYMYAMSDQMGACILGLLYLQREEGTWRKTIRRYLHHPVMLVSFTVIIYYQVLLSELYSCSTVIVAINADGELLTI